MDEWNSVWKFSWLFNLAEMEFQGTNMLESKCGPSLRECWHELWQEKNVAFLLC